MLTLGDDKVIYLYGRNLIYVPIAVSFIAMDVKCMGSQ